MSAKYTAEVRRYGGSHPYVDRAGHRKNLSHRDNLAGGEVNSDGIGNVISMPLLRGKPCFGRPERFTRGIFEGKAWYDDHGERKPGETPCHFCEKKSSRTFLACQKISLERIASSPPIEQAFIEWCDATGDNSGRVCFNGANLKRWQSFLEAIEAHGGWSNINDDQVKAAAITKAEEQRRRRRDREKARRQTDRQKLKSPGAPITSEFANALDAERNRRAIHLKSLRNIRGAKPQDTLWLRNLPDKTCERIADVWRARELLRHRDGLWTGKEIAGEMMYSGRAIGIAMSTLQSRVSDDLKRIKKLEDDISGGSLWDEWTFN